MPKIKQKVEMTPKELIKWAFENNIRNKSYKDYDDYGNSISIHFDNGGLPLLSYGICADDTLAVEIEEEIDEDTVFPVLVRTFKNASKEIKASIFYNASINSSISYCETTSYHLLNNDGTMTLLWKDGAMVDD
ncbi:hypothetical protein [Staphylococcus haemolyticus]|uniref:hypothetical protein n=1 Tax=Staphylococcus haemolyticus TaxID=1283 RepID=UPI001F0B06EB|nr:hypothetical protein [Staphylococcus haemolyticus]MCH4384170.1 hypothetical protein [Staphylococcus haemolyticus]